MIQKHILYILPSLPYKNIDHAGGKFLYEYLMQISKTCHITLLVPNIAENSKVFEEVNDNFDVILTNVLTESLTDKFLKLSNLFFEPIYHSYEDLLIKKIIELDLLDKVDIVEIHYSQLMRLIPRIKDIDKEIPIFFYSYDVYFQSIMRHMKAKDISILKKIKYKIKFINVRNKERLYLNDADEIFTFSEKDNKLLTSIGIKTNITDVSLFPQLNADTTHIDDGFTNILFVGAFKRYENIQGALWFLEKVWPILDKKYENIRLYLVGSSPSSQILDSQSKKVIVTGFVEDLDYYHKIADIAVVPLFLGAGVKYKVLHSFYFKLPVVSTSVGAEGIKAEAFADITDDSIVFTRTIELLIKDKKLREQIGNLGKKVLNEHYNFKKKTIDILLSAYQKHMDKHLKE